MENSQKQTLTIEEQLKLEREITAMLRAALVFPFDIDCGDNSCRFAKNKTGMRTNGGCRCASFFDNERKVQDLLRHILKQQQALAREKEMRK